MSVKEALIANKKALEKQIELLQGDKYEPHRWKLRLWLTQIELKLEAIPVDPSDKGDFWNSYVS